MRFLALSLVFTAVWAAVTGSASLPNLFLGFALGALCLWLTREHIAAGPRRIRLLPLLALAALFARELALSVWRVTLTVLSPKPDVKPGIFAFPLTVRGDFEIALLANLITLTPGTLSVDLSPDRRLLYVHAMDCSDPDGARRDIAAGFERRIMEAFPR